MCVPTLSCMVSSLSCISLRSPSMSVLREEMALSLFLTSTPSCWFLSFNCRISSWRLVTWWGRVYIQGGVLRQMSFLLILYFTWADQRHNQCFVPQSSAHSSRLMLNHRWWLLSFPFFIRCSSCLYFAPTLLYTLRVRAHTHNMQLYVAEGIEVERG